MGSLILSLVTSMFLSNEQLAVEIDSFLDGDLEQKELLRTLKAEDVSLEQLESLLLAPRATYADLPFPVGKQTGGHRLLCQHVDYETSFEIYVPSNYSPDRSWPLVLVGHGGNSEMSQERAEATARSYLRTWCKTAEEKGLICVAPATARGWGRIGNAILLSTISAMKRLFPIDPHRVYATGHSMGGHMSWRCAIGLGDRFGAVGPMSGGYDYVDNEQIYRAFNVPGYATHGKNEPYQIADFNRKIWGWLQEHNYDWVVVEKEGGHEIFSDELPKCADFFLNHPRDLYREAVFAHTGSYFVINEAEPKKGRWPKKHLWNQALPIDHGIFHWVRVVSHPRWSTSRPKVEGGRRAMVRRVDRKTIEVTSQQIPKLRLYLHPKMFDLDGKIDVVINGKSKKIKPELGAEIMLDLVKEFDDRGRIFHGYVEVDIKSNRKVPIPVQ